MPVPSMDGPVVDHQRRFQAAVDVIQNLPKNGLYRPSYEVMLRFYSLYKQAVCGTCTAPRPGFWDPVGRYKWDAWSRLGTMSSESAMAAYVEEMKKVAQEVIDTMPMNEKTASLFHHFEPLYLVIEDMPRPPETLLTLTDGQKTDGSTQIKKDEDDQQENKDEEKEEEKVQTGACALPEVPQMEIVEVMEMTAESVHQDSGVSECLVLTSDSETEIFCDSVDSMEQLSSIKVPIVKSNGIPNGHMVESSGPQEARQVGAGQGGEGGSDGKGQGRASRRRDGGRDDPHHSWRERGVPQGGARWGAPVGGGGAAGRGGGDGSEGGVERLHDVQLQQQIMVALSRLREDMRSVMERLEVVERLTATHVDGSQWETCPHCSAARQKEERWWPFDMSAQMLLLFLVWPFVAQGMVTMVRKIQRRSRPFS